MLVASFSGWNDAANAASTALGAIAASLETELIARIDPEEFFDFQANRPAIEITDGEMQGIQWPDNLFVAAHAEGAERDLLIISGTEPSTRWRTFCNAVLDVAERCGVESVVTFGSLIADVAHTRPVPITGLATDEAMIEQLGFEDVAYEGPTGVARRLPRRLPGARPERRQPLGGGPPLRGGSPQPEGGPRPPAPPRGDRRHRRRGLRARGRRRQFETQVSQAVAANPEIREMVERLEEQQDEVAGFTQEDVPSGDTIADDFQRFLRQQSD